jgi:hypothetical protein
VSEMAPLRVAKSLQPSYNRDAHYLPLWQNLPFHKSCTGRMLCQWQRMCNVFNARCPPSGKGATWCHQTSPAGQEPGLPMNRPVQCRSLPILIMCSRGLAPEVHPTLFASVSAPSRCRGNQPRTPCISTHEALCWLTDTGKDLMHIRDLRVDADFVLCSEGLMFLLVQGGHVLWQRQQE